MIIELTEDIPSGCDDGNVLTKGSHYKVIGENITLNSWLIRAEGDQWHIDRNQCIEVKETPSEDTTQATIDAFKAVSNKLSEGMENMVGQTNNHDSHYSSDQIETINIQEQLILTNLPKEHHEQVLRNFRIATAFKYISRCGKKDDVKKEITKAINYLTRARDGEWAK